MNEELKNALKNENSDKLFYYFKHDGAIDFEKKIIAGKILHGRGYDQNKLFEEKQLITDSIEDRISSYENTNDLTAKNKRKINRGIFLGLGYLSAFLLIGLKGYIAGEEPLDWIAIAVMILLTLVFIVYKLVTYGSKLEDMLQKDMNDKELQKLRLQLIDREWDF